MQEQANKDAELIFGEQPSSEDDTYDALQSALDGSRKARKSDKFWYHCILVTVICGVMMVHISGVGQGFVGVFGIITLLCSAKRNDQKWAVIILEWVGRHLTQIFSGGSP